jgi:hypothetical protein
MAIWQEFDKKPMICQEFLQNLAILEIVEISKNMAIGHAFAVITQLDNF